MQGAFGCSNSQLQRTDVGHETKKQRNKRTQRTGEKAAPRSKKRKKEEEEKQAIYPNADTFIQLKQVGIRRLANPAREHLKEWLSHDENEVVNEVEFWVQGLENKTSQKKEIQRFGFISVWNIYWLGSIH